MITQSSTRYGREARSLLAQALSPDIAGARALIESFYFAFNRRDMEVFREVWANDDLIQLNNPLGGILRGYTTIANLYEQVFSGPARVWVELADVVEFQTNEMVVFAGRERGEFTTDAMTLPLSIRTSRVVQWFGPQLGWKQIHHHGSIDDSSALEQYQRAVRG